MRILILGVHKRGGQEVSALWLVWLKAGGAAQQVRGWMKPLKIRWEGAQSPTRGLPTKIHPSIVLPHNQALLASSLHEIKLLAYRKD